MCERKILKIFKPFMFADHQFPIAVCRLWNWAVHHFRFLGNDNAVCTGMCQNGVDIKAVRFNLKFAKFGQGRVCWIFRLSLFRLCQRQVLFLFLRFCCTTRNSHLQIPGASFYMEDCIRDPFDWHASSSMCRSDLFLLVTLNSSVRQSFYRIRCLCSMNFRNTTRLSPSVNTNRYIGAARAGTKVSTVQGSSCLMPFCTSSKD
mmetsp:Transcript_15859/g.64809  ORF Transcript_15859/g.64809 Transcript_15859/m.64809 type:complete len:203 (-) Transcript_15859:422-1030(-)